MDEQKRDDKSTAADDTEGFVDKAADDELSAEELSDNELSDVSGGRGPNITPMPFDKL